MDKLIIQNQISKLPISSYNKIRLYNYISRIYWKFSCSPGEYDRRINKNSFVPSGLYYGQEQWMKEYCSFNDIVYAYIEHGVYFGDNRSKVGWSPEWDLGNIITFGDSRYNLLKDIYPDYNIVRVGPRIHYAPTDLAYKEYIKSKLLPDSKTMTLYPAHAIHDDSHSFNTKGFIDEALEVANSLNIKNILVSLHPIDLAHGVELQYQGMNMIVVSGGSSNEGFLPRLKAIMELSDLTYSNALGTHVGYSIYMGTPHILSTSSNPPRSKCEFSSNVTNRIYQERTLFENVFSGKDGMSITKEQIDLCDYYWGFSHVKSSELLYRELSNCKNHFFQHFKKIK